MNIVSSSQTTAFTSSSSKIATTGSHGYVLHSSSKKHIWVIDTGATDHMTFDPGQLTSHTPSSQSVVSNANGHLQQFTEACGQPRLLLLSPPPKVLLFIRPPRSDIAYAVSVEEYFMAHLPSWAPT
ncbi:hypothetical protein L3X38_015899 [Prunus dulcis]|uniref:Uncharacterized protein n=1 Tax=Prunus dulcis TaxID=3755 RepID=A0AAD4W6T8_PRUDU|nr:hypothetical protein L3X38_015899 [Prunus dulcis]